ncbi:hypothetical protein CEK28_05360 [Xenophilus sp. AP218F]|nr:hypothetical protein CEK28_05360 [Xenophilus sp. AP218F]
MKIEASDKEIQDILKLGYFKIPRFQRPYSWGKEEVVRFWDDIVGDENDNYFIGSMVVYQERRPYFGIVDGQQRLTTITIVLAVIRDFFKKLGEDDLAIGVQNFIERANVDNRKEYIVDSETSFPFFQGVIQSFSRGIGFDVVGVEEKNLEDAYNCIRDCLSRRVSLDTLTEQFGLFNSIDGIEEVKRIRDKFLSLKLVFIQLESEEDAYLIFETLNARGRDLTTPDLIKNLLLKILKPDNVRLDRAKESWNLIATKFPSVEGRDLLGNFIYHFWLSSRKYITEKQIFSEVKGSVKSVGDANELIQSLSADSDLYIKIIEPDSVDWSREESDLYDSISSLKLFNVKQHFSMLISVLRAKDRGLISLRYLKKVIRDIENFHFVFNAVTSQRSSGSIATHYSKYAIELSNAVDSGAANSIIESMLVGLREKIPSFEEFYVNLKGFNYHSKATKDKAVIRYCLSKALGGVVNGCAVDFSGMTIEHILPESRKGSGVSEKIYGNIGNLILIDAKTNSDELKDYDFSRKIEILREKNYPLDDVIENATSWGEGEIERRCKYLAEKIYPKI